MLSKIKLPAEEFPLPVMWFNDVVGPLFAELKDRFLWLMDTRTQVSPTHWVFSWSDASFKHHSDWKKSSQFR